MDKDGNLKSPASIPIAKSISSKVDDVDSSCCFSVNSKMDVLIPIAESISSKVDNIEVDTSCCYTVNSKVDILIPITKTVSSKVDTINSELFSFVLNETSFSSTSCIVFK